MNETVLAKSRRLTGRQGLPEGRALGEGREVSITLPCPSPYPLHRDPRRLVTGFSGDRKQDGKESPLAKRTGSRKEYRGRFLCSAGPHSPPSPMLQKNR